VYIILCAAAQWKIYIKSQFETQPATAGGVCKLLYMIHADVVTAARERSNLSAHTPPECNFSFLVNFGDSIAPRSMGFYEVISARRRPRFDAAAAVHKKKVHRILF
jgi:hypothetical protein